MTWTAYIGVGKCGKFKLDRGSVLAAVSRGYSATSVIGLAVWQNKLLVMKNLRLTWGDSDRLVCCAVLYVLGIKFLLSILISVVFGIFHR